MLRHRRQPQTSAKLVPLTVACVAAAVAVVVAASASDNFNRADNTTLGSNWTDPVAQWGISADQAYEYRLAGSSFNYAVTWWNNSTNAFGADQFSQITCATFEPSAQCGAAVRFGGSSFATFNGYQCELDIGGSWAIQRVDAGAGAPSSAILASGSTTVTSGDVLYCQISGTTLTMKQNGSTLGTGTDATYSSGQPGISVYDPLGTLLNKFDDWSGGDLGGGGATFPNAIVQQAPMKGCCTWPFLPPRRFR